MGNFTTTSSRYKRAYFFDVEPNSTGDRFRSQNIPSEDMYKKLFGSQAFIAEPNDMAKTNQQGLVRIYSDTNAILNRNNDVVVAGSQYVLKPHQAPGVGVNFAGDYAESQFVGLVGVPITGGGIQITGKVYSDFGFDRIGMQVEIHLSSIGAAYINVPTGALVPILLTDGTQGLALYNDGSSPSRESVSYEHEQAIAALTWTVNHNFGWKPNINVEVGGVPALVQWAHVDENSLQVFFTTAQTGSVYCS